MSEIIDENNYLSNLEEERNFLVRKERNFVRMERWLSVIWFVVFVAGIITAFFDIAIGASILFMSAFFACLDFCCSSYLMGVSEGKLEQTISVLIRYEKEMEKDGKD